MICIVISDGCPVEGLSKFCQLFWEGKRSYSGVW